MKEVIQLGEKHEIPKIATTVRVAYIRDPHNAEVSPEVLDDRCPNRLGDDHPEPHEVEAFLRHFHIPLHYPNVLIPHGHYRRLAKKEGVVDEYWVRDRDEWFRKRITGEAPCFSSALVLIRMS
jgi:hypothetical protein